MVKAPWLLMLETDYVWMKPLLARGSAYDPQVQTAQGARHAAGSGQRRSAGVHYLLAALAMKAAVWCVPLQVPGLAFRFDYIAPQNPTVAQILAEKCPTCDPATVPG